MHTLRGFTIGQFSTWASTRFGRIHRMDASSSHCVWKRWSP